MHPRCLPAYGIGAILLLLIGVTSMPAPIAAQTAPPAEASGATFALDGAHLAPVVGLRLAALGRGDALAPVHPVAPTDDGSRVQYAYGDVTEWYPRAGKQGGGIEQGITLAAPPMGTPPLSFTIATPGLIPLVDDDGEAATLILPTAAGKHEQWRYDGLRVTDAAGRVLLSHLASTEGGVRILVDDTDAVYPITVDPFVQRQTLAVSGATFFGHTVALSGDGNTALIGAQGTNSNAGTAYIFTRGAGGFSQFGPTLVASGTSAFGSSVALSTDGSTALVGAIGTDANTDKAFVFTRGTSGYTQFGPPLASSGASYFGFSVALSGDGNTALVGAYGTYNFQGTISFFTRGTSGYTPFGFVTSGGSSTTYFGYAVALSADGSTALVGASGGAGGAYILTRGTSGYTLGPLLSVSGTTSFGYAVALSADGSTALVGARYTNNQVVTAYVFTRSGPVYSQSGSPLAGSRTFLFGVSVALSGDGGTALMGAEYDTDYYTGIAYVFTAPPLISSDGATTAQTAVVGQPFANRFGAFVTDGYGSPLSGATVTFRAPVAGASGTFTGGVTTATATTDATGYALAPAFTANTAAGNYDVVASITNSGGTGSALFSLTNAAGAAASITVFSGNGQSAMLGNAFAAPLQAIVRDSHGNAVSGITVRFSAPTGTNIPTVTL